MFPDDLLRLAHVIGATVLFGTGAGIAFFMLMASRTRDARLIAHVAGTVVVADTVFTATAVVFQPITGYLLATSIGWSLAEGWIALSLILYVVTGLFWLPVVWIQIRLRNLAQLAAAENTPLPPAFDRLYAIWFACGLPAFFAVVGIFWLMLAKPQFQLF
ncbi:UNVERIFIED_ORG: putative membrane protein [Ensifer adhaerens]|nr:putative membrane protein [Ensifer adhaerens]